MKYIIKNCPAIKETTLLLTSEPPQLKREYRCCTTGSNLKKCENIESCVMKRIVEKCKEVNTKFYDSVHQRYLSPSKAKFAREIMELLDIQEVE